MAHPSLHARTLALALSIASAILCGGRADAQVESSNPAPSHAAGTLKFRNTSGAAIALSNFRYTDGDGKIVKITGKFELAEGYDGPLWITIGGDKEKAFKIVAGSVDFDLLAAGKTTSQSFKKQTGKGYEQIDFFIVFNATDMTAHKKTGKTDEELVAAKRREELEIQVAAAEKQRRETAKAQEEAAKEREAALQEVARLEAKLTRETINLVGFRLAAVAAEVAYDRARPGSFEEFLAKAAYTAAYGIYLGCESNIKQLRADLRSAESKSSYNR